MQQDIIIIADWLKEINLQLNIQKSHYMIFDKHKQYNNIPPIQLNNNILNRVMQTKYLGLIIDSKLSWNQHIQKIKNKIRPIIFAIKRLHHCLHEAAIWEHLQLTHKLNLRIPNLSLLFLFGDILRSSKQLVRWYIQRCLPFN